VSGYWFGNPGRTYDVDQERFLFLKDAGATLAGARRQIHVVENWIDELKRRVPVK
jgi:hypothetical protein